MWHSAGLMVHTELCSGNQVELKVGLMDPKYITIRPLGNIVNIN